MRVASRFAVPVVPQGARSGLSGAANAIDGCILLSLEKMKQVLEIDAANRLVVTQPGIFNAELSRAVEAEGLFYPPDPSSWEFCSIGGNVATNSGGLCCVKYGVTTDYVLGLEVVLADGEVLRTGRRTVKGVAGYDLTRLFVGSEGTLGVITEITLMLRPAVGAAADRCGRLRLGGDCCAGSDGGGDAAASYRRCWSSWTAPACRRSTTLSTWGCRRRPRRSSSPSPTPAASGRRPTSRRSRRSSSAAGPSRSRSPKTRPRASCCWPRGVRC